MNLFIDTVSQPCFICIFDNNRDIINHISWDIAGNESSTLIPKLEGFLEEYSIKYSDIENIVLVNGPGSFTGVRTAVLVVNSLNFILKKNLTALSYFDLFDQYPIVKSSSRRDCFVQKTSNDTIEIISNVDVENYFERNNINHFHGSVHKGLFENYENSGNINYDKILKNIEFDSLEKIEPLYIKKPNIC